MALPANALVDVATTREWLHELSGATDADVERLIGAASATADRYARRTLAQATYTHYLSPKSARRTLALPARPVASITSVTIAADGNWDSGTLVTDHDVDGVTGILYRRSGVFTPGLRNIRVVYVAGYALADVPAELQHAVVEVVAWIQRRAVGNQIGLSSHGYGDESTTYELTPPTSAQRVFESYRDLAGVAG